MITKINLKVRSSENLQRRTNIYDRTKNLSKSLICCTYLIAKYKSKNIRIDIPISTNSTFVLYRFIQLFPQMNSILYNSTSKTNTNITLSNSNRNSLTFASLAGANPSNLLHLLQRNTGSHTSTITIKSQIVDINSLSDYLSQKK